MLRCYVILLVLVSQICFSQVTEVQQSECDAEDKDLLSVKEETVSVLKLLKEENHTEDPDHLSVASSRGANSKDIVHSSSNTGQKKEQNRVDKSAEGHGQGSLKKVVSKEHLSTDRIHPSTAGKGNNNNEVDHKSNSYSKSASSKDVSHVIKSIRGTPTTNSKKLNVNIKDNGQKLTQITVDPKPKAINSERPQNTAVKKEASDGGQRPVISKEIISNHKAVGQKLNQTTVDHTSNSKVMKTALPSTIRKEGNIVTKSSDGPRTVVSKDIPNNKVNSQKLTENKVIQNSSSKIVVNGVLSPNTVLKKEASEVRSPPGEHLPSNSKQVLTKKLKSSHSQSLEKNKLVQQKSEQTVKVVATTNKEINTKHDVSNTSPSKKSENIIVNPQKISDTTKPVQVKTVSKNTVKSVSVEAKGSSDSTVSSDTKQRLKRSVQQSDDTPPTERSYTVANKSVVKVNESISSNIQQSDASPPTEKSYNNARKSVVLVNESHTSNIQQSGGSPPTEKSYNNVRKSVVLVNESHISNIQQSGVSPPTEKSYNNVRKSVVLVNESHTSNIQQSGGSPPTEKSFNKVSKPLVTVNESLISNVQQADGSPPPGKSDNKISKSAVKVDASLTSNTKLSQVTSQRLKPSISDEAFDSSSVVEKPYSVTESSSPLPNRSTQNSVPATLSTHSKKPEDVDKLHVVTKQESSHKAEGCETKESIKELPHVSRSNLSPPSSSAANINSDKDVPIIKEVCHADISSKVISSLDAHAPGKEISNKYETQVKLSDNDSHLVMENKRNETKEKEEEIKVPDAKTAPNARALQMEQITEHEVQLKITEKPNGGRMNDIKITSVEEDIRDEKGDQQSKLQHENTMTSALTHTEKYAEEQLFKPLRLQSEPIKTLSVDESTISNEDAKLESQEDNLSVEGVVESKLIINDEDTNGREVEIQQGGSHLQVVTETSVSDEPKAEALEQEGDFTSWKQKRTHRNLPDENPTKSPALEFPTVPEGDSFRIHELGLSEGLFVFSYLGSFLSWMQPYDFPVELLRDALWNRLSIVSLITQSLQVEMGFIACLCIGVLLALAAPFFLMIHACCSLVRRSQSSNTWEDDTTSSSDNQGNCRRRTLVFLLQTILLLLVAGIVAMFVTNEQLSSAVQQTPKVVHTALSDVTTFLRNSNLQLNFVVTKSLDQAVETASADLDNVETLLGRPIQRELEAETGVDVALDALVDVTASAQTLSNKVNALHEYCGETRGLALVAQERLADLRHQVDMLRRQCPAKDRALCETVEGSGLDVVLQLDSVLNDQRLAGLRRLSQSNLSQVTQQARGEFQFIPMHVEKETRDARNGVRRQLLRQRSILDDSVWSIEAITRDLGVRVEAARDRSLEMVRGASDMEQWRYLTGIGAAVAVLLIWLLLVGAISCGCCGAEDKARPTLLVTVGVLCPLYLALWALAMVALLVGGHGEVFVCRPLYDEPGYGALTKLMDKPGVLFQRGGGFFSSLLYGNDSLNVPLKDVLMACQQNRPSYPAFRLHQVFDVDSASDHHGWEALHRQLARLEVNLTDLQLLTPDLQRQLQELLNAASVNLTSHRVQLSGPVTGKDLLSFSDQLESVANQITDLATASRMETLATRTRRLLASHIAPLTQRKEDMVYQLTSLEVQLVPLQRQVNQSLSHLKTIQFFINNQGANISHIKSQEYISRIVGYLQQYRDHVLDATATHVAPCRPVWDLFHAMRVLFCRHVMDPLNGFWFATVWCLLLLLVAIPLCLKLAACYRQSKTGSLLPRSHTESPPEAGNIPDPPEPSRPWATPGETEQEGW